MTANAADFAGSGCGRRYEKELETHFRDCLLFYLDGRIRFERYCYGEAACLVFSVWAHGFDADGNILWDREPEFESQKTAIPRVLTDIQEDGDNFVLEADLPGFKKEDIHVDVADDRLTVSAERHSNFEDKDKKGNYLRCERSYGSYARSFDISGIDAAGIKAAYADGVLRATLPKQKEVPASSRRLEIE